MQFTVSCVDNWIPPVSNPHGEDVGERLQVPIVRFSIVNQALLKKRLLVVLTTRSWKALLPAVSSVPHPESTYIAALIHFQHWSSIYVRCCSVSAFEWVKVHHSRLSSWWIIESDFSGWVYWRKPLVCIHPRILVCSSSASDVGWTLMLWLKNLANYRGCRNPVAIQQDPAKDTSLGMS